MTGFLAGWLALQPSLPYIQVSLANMLIDCEHLKMSSVATILNNKTHESSNIANSID